LFDASVIEALAGTADSAGGLQGESRAAPLAPLEGFFVGVGCDGAAAVEGLR